MTDKTMPERIWLVPSELSESTVWTTQEVEDPNEPGQAAYIRADLVTALARSDGALEKRHLEQMAATLLSGLMATADKARLATGAASEPYIDWAIRKAKEIQARNTWMIKRTR